MARDLDGTIAERSRTMLGLLTYDQLQALGVSRQRRRTLVAKGVLIPAGGKVLRHAAHPQSWRQQALAAVLAAGPGAVASHMTAAALWGFDGIQSPGRPEVTVPAGRQPRAVPGRVHRCRDLTPADVDLRAPVPCTTPLRTICDIAASLDLQRLEAVLDHAERTHQLWRPKVRWRLAALRRRGRPGLATLEALLDRTDGRPLGDSWLEQEAIRIIGAAGLPMPQVQVGLRGPGGPGARVDLLWGQAELVAELTGHGSHSTRRERQSDAERAAHLGLRGWRVLQFTYEDVVERPGYVVAMLRAYLQAGRRQAPASADPRPPPTATSPPSRPRATGHLHPHRALGTGPRSGDRRRQRAPAPAPGELRPQPAPPPGTRDRNPHPPPGDPRPQPAPAHGGPATATRTRPRGTRDGNAHPHPGTGDGDGDGDGHLAMAPSPSSGWWEVVGEERRGRPPRTCARGRTTARQLA